MMKASTLLEQTQDQFPSKSYHRRKNKTNILLHKMQNDAGYPQDLFSTKSYQSSDKEKDYLKLNSKNLKNFFADRIPQNDIDIFKFNYTIDPTKILQFRRKQYQLKLQTKIELDNTLNSDLSLSTIQPKKITETFLVRDKNLEFRKKFLEEDNRKIKRPYYQNNYRKGTQSYIKKYLSIGKKQAYNSTFGIEEELIQTSIETSRKNAISLIQTKNRPFSLDQNRAKQRRKQKSELQLKSQKKFSLAIQRLDKHRQQLDPDDRSNRKPYVKRQFKSNQLQKKGKQDMINWISETTRQYQNKVINDGIENLFDLEDLKKLNKAFYKELIEHKSKRLKFREYQIGNRQIQSNRTSRHSQNQMNETQTLMVNDFGQKIKHESFRKSKNLSLSNSCSSDQDSEAQEGIKGNWGSQKKLSVIQKFQKFGHELVVRLYRAKFFGITDKKYVYLAFWQHNQPYQLEGAYAFFKAIKQNDMAGVKKFLAISKSYLYEKDYKGRSPLIYACINDHSSLCKFFIEQQINLDFQDLSKKTALYYAIKNENAYVVELLLKKGCDPWSTPSCSYKDILERIENNQIERLMKNSKKIWIAMSLIGDRATKYKFWLSMKNRISTKNILRFQ